MKVNLLVRRTDRDPVPEPGQMLDWKLFEDWPDAERVPPKGELLKLGNGREMRVIEVCQTGPAGADVFLVATYEDPMGRLG